ncbi:unnamed protein product [Protopolystoma xenopodis]|uniref:Uncharacterized protein n=1 Tax=Protopolystoma xenopodis TaxID=117903 RepID=A0A3S5BWF7_9PLAT|nr:unnamed protein product [Protopolystoma xenopodis]
MVGKKKVVPGAFIAGHPIGVGRVRDSEWWPQVGWMVGRTRTVDEPPPSRATTAAVGLLHVAASQTGLCALAKGGWPAASVWSGGRMVFSCLFISPVVRIADCLSKRAKRPSYLAPGETRFGASQPVMLTSRPSAICIRWPESGLCPPAARLAPGLSDHREPSIAHTDGWMRRRGGPKRGGLIEPGADKGRAEPTTEPVTTSLAAGRKSPGHLETTETVCEAAV